MAKKKLHDKPKEKAEQPSGNQGVSRQETKQPVFYRCTCPECGEEALELYGFGVFSRSEFLGVTNGAEFGCGGDFELLGSYQNWMIRCRSCECTALEITEPSSDDDLLEWAATHGQPVKKMEFTCPVCGTDHLDQIEIGVEKNRSVRAVYEIAQDTETEDPTNVVLSFEPAIGYGSVRYRCTRGHELINEDGSPVETEVELVEWLKAHQPSDKK